MARQYYVEGTKSYLIAACVLAALSIWHIWDGWVPQARWRGAEAVAEVSVNDIQFAVSSREVGVRFNDRSIQFLPMAQIDADVSEPAGNVVWVYGEAQFTVFIAPDATLADFENALADHIHFKIVREDDIDPNVPIDGLIGQEVSFSGGRDGKYPNFPEEWHDFSPQEFYAYNRWTGVLLGIAAIVCAYIHRVVR